MGVCVWGPWVDVTGGGGYLNVKQNSLNQERSMVQQLGTLLHSRIEYGSVQLSTGGTKALVLTIWCQHIFYFNIPQRL